jgi:hypothetical protein
MNPLATWLNADEEPHLTDFQIAELAQKSGLASIDGEAAKDTFGRLTTDVFFNGCPTYDVGSNTTFSTLLQWANGRNELLRSASNSDAAGGAISENLELKSIGAGESSTTTALLKALVQAMASKDNHASQVLNRESSLLKLLDGGSEENHPLYKISSKVVKKIANNLCVVLADIRAVMPNAGVGLYAKKTPKSIRSVPARQLEASQKLRTVLAIMGNTHGADIEIQKNLREYEQNYAEWWRAVTPAGVNALDMLFREFWESNYAKSPLTFKFDANPPELALKAALLLTIHKLPDTFPSCTTCGSLECLTATCQFSAPATLGFAGPNGFPPLANRNPNFSEEPTCRDFNSNKGCSNPSCSNKHNCLHCGMRNHGITSCFKRHPELKPSPFKRQRTRSPPSRTESRRDRRQQRGS